MKSVGFAGTILAAITLASCGDNSGNEAVETEQPAPIADADMPADVVAPVAAVSEPEPIVAAEAAPEPEPIIAAEATPEPEPAVEARAPEPIIAAEAAPEPIIAAEAAPEPEPAVEAPAPEPIIAAEAVPEPEVNDVAEHILAEAALSPEFEAMIDEADPVAGRSQAQRCSPCHSFREEERLFDRPGPNLFAIVNGPIAGVEIFEYSLPFTQLGAAGLTWTNARLSAFLSDPRTAVPGTKMTVSGVSDDTDRANLIAFLATLAPEPETLDTDILQVLIDRIAAADPTDGETIAARCASCHTIGRGEDALVGPNLYDIVGASVGRDPDFNYSGAFRSLGEEGAIWTFERLDAYLENPAIAVPGTRMGFSGISDETDRAAVIAFLRSLSVNPVPLNVEALAVAQGQERQLGPLTFTAEQASAGLEAYGREDCLRCHGVSLTGVVNIRDGALGEGPALIGVNFGNRWFSGSVTNLFRYTFRNMPPDGAGGLPDEVYIQILAYVLFENGFSPGQTPMPMDEELLRQMGFYQ